MSNNILKDNMLEIQSVTLDIFSTENHPNQSQWVNPENMTGPVTAQCPYPLASGFCFTLGNGRQSTKLLYEAESLFENLKTYCLAFLKSTRRFSACLVTFLLYCIVCDSSVSDIKWKCAEIR